jgi:serine/arginine repetitive matrix protein 2
MYLTPPFVVNSTARKPSKADDAKAILDTATKQLRAEEADVFRGLHLDPNIHHWDEVCFCFL